MGLLRIIMQEAPIDTCTWFFVTHISYSKDVSIEGFSCQSGSSSFSFLSTSTFYYFSFTIFDMVLESSNPIF